MAENLETNAAGEYRAPVALIPCEDYQEEHVDKALAAAIKAVDGFDGIRPGMTVALKVNLVSGMAPSKAGTTHPVVAAALCRMLIERGCKVIVGDSPGGLYTAGFVNHIYKAAGMSEVEKTGAQLNQDFSVKTAFFEEGIYLKNFSYTGWLDNADVIINICKLKSHGMMAMTCGVKNMFGTVPGLTKPEYHMRFQDVREFAGAILDLNAYFHPVLTICDAIDGMEGNGPTAGKCRHIGCLLASTSQYDLDMVAADLIGMSIQDVATLQGALDRGVGPASLEEVNLVGRLDAGRDVASGAAGAAGIAAGAAGAFAGESAADTLRRLHISNFKKATWKTTRFYGGGDKWTLKGAVIELVFATKPKVTARECIGCGKCGQICPAKAITMTAGKKDKSRLTAVPSGNADSARPAAGAVPARKLPVIDRDKCIHCFCCQEFCPEGAMKVHHNVLGKIVQAVSQG